MKEDFHLSGTYISCNSYYNMILKAVTRSKGTVNVVCFTGINQQSVTIKARVAIHRIVSVHRRLGLHIEVSMEICNDNPVDKVRETYFS